MNIFLDTRIFVDLHGTLCIISEKQCSSHQSTNSFKNSLRKTSSKFSLLDIFRDNLSSYRPFNYFGVYEIL